MRWLTRTPIIALPIVIGFAVGLTGCNSSNATSKTVRPDSASQKRPSHRESPQANAGTDQHLPQPADPSIPAWFRDVLDQSSISFRHVSGDSVEKPFPSANGSGLAVIDYDRDGNVDLYFATGCEFPIELKDTSPTNRLYRNLGGVSFVDVSSASHTDCNGYSAGLAVGDFDQDGFPDMYVSCYGQDILFRNQGDGTFEEVQEQAGIKEIRWGTGVAFLDYDEDGLLDIYVCNYSTWTWETRAFCGDETRKIRTHCGPRSVEGEFSFLWHNEGDGTFVDKLAEAGLNQRACRGQGVVAADIDGDGHTDLYVTNDLHPNFLFMNKGDGTFRDVTESSGAAYDARGNSQAGMGVDCADINQDGRLDLFVTNFAMDYNTIYINMGRDNFQDLTSRFGIVTSSMPWIGWGTSLADFDMDGYLDMFVTNGHVDSNRHLLGENSTYKQPPLLYRGKKQGKFDFLGASGGEYFQELHAGRGLAVSDIDNDGDLDVVISHQDAMPALLLNQKLQGSNFDHSAIRIQLVGRTVNRDATGATIRADFGTRKLTFALKGGGSYLSANDPRITIAVRPSETNVQLDIQWPGGNKSEVSGLQGGGDYVIIEPSFVFARSKTSASSAGTVP